MTRPSGSRAELATWIERCFLSDLRTCGHALNGCGGLVIERGMERAMPLK